MYPRVWVELWIKVKELAQIFQNLLALPSLAPVLG